MASGTILGTTSNQYIQAKVEWRTDNVDIAKNQSTVHASLYYRRTNTGYTTYGTGKFLIKIGDTSTRLNKSITINGDWVLAVTAEKTVTHNNDGTKSIFISGDGNISGTTLNSTSCADTVELDTIGRAATIDEASAANLGGLCRIKWTPLSTNHVFSLKFELGEWSDATGYLDLPERSLNQVTYTGYSLPLEVANQIPDDTSGKMTVTLYTYNEAPDGEITYIASNSASFTVYVPENDATRPDITMTLSCANPSTIPEKFKSYFIQGQSKVRGYVSASCKYSAATASRTFTVDGKGYARSSDLHYYSETLTRAGSITVVGGVKDSRGFVTTEKRTITVQSYSPPKLVKASGYNSIICARCDSSGNLTASGTCLKIVLGISLSSVKGLNSATLKYRVKKASATTYGEYTFLTLSNNAVNVTLPNVVSDITAFYTVEISVQDEISGAVINTFDVPTDNVLFHLPDDIDAAAFGQYADKDKTLSIAPDWGMQYKGDDIEKKFFSLRGNTLIPANSNLNNYITPDVYAVSTDDAAATISNMPTNRAGQLRVYAITGQDKVTEGTWKYVMQEYRSVIASEATYRRMLNSNAEGTWTFGNWTGGEVLDTGWVSVELSSDMATASQSIRNGKGLKYRVMNNHVYITFNCAFTWDNSSIAVNGAAIPKAYRPKNNVYAICVCGEDRLYVARVSIDTGGWIYVNLVSRLGSLSDYSHSVDWIDGYIDYII